MLAKLPLARVCRAGEMHWGSFYGLTVDLPMEVSNEGRRCFARSRYKDDSWESVRVITPPSHGIASAYVSAERRGTWLRYAPTAGYVGTDEFAVRVEPLHQRLVVHVTVLPLRTEPQIESSEPTVPAG